MAGIQGETRKPNKIFSDPIHGSIELHPYLIRIIDTPQFQRLRYIRQMGSVYFVYPGVSHNRFEHSIGVAHLAGELVQALNKQYRDHPDPELTEKILGSRDNEDLITEEEGMCVQIAALCHDLGHGPFSHMFDEKFLPRAAETADEEKKRKLKAWTHEKQSIRMLKALIADMNKPEEGRKKLEGDDELIGFMKKNLPFIEELIDPPETRTNPKSFLYEIVSNKRNGIDVDKMDYFARDCYHLGIQSNFDHKRFLKFARVCLCDDGMQICMRDKEVYNIYELYHTRNNIHMKACQHKVVTAIDEMIVDALLEADKALEISDSALDVEKFLNLTDGIYQKILDYSEPNDSVKKAQNILRSINSRNLYKCVHVARIKDGADLTQFQDEVEAWTSKPGENIGTRTIKMIYGMHGEDPIEQVKFYTKLNPCEARFLEQHEVSQLLPSVFREEVRHIFSKRL